MSWRSWMELRYRFRIFAACKTRWRCSLANGLLSWPLPVYQPSSGAIIRLWFLYFIYSKQRQVNTICPTMNIKGCNCAFANIVQLHHETAAFEKRSGGENIDAIEDIYCISSQSFQTADCHTNGYEWWMFVLQRPAPRAEAELVILNKDQNGNWTHGWEVKTVPEL